MPTPSSGQTAEHGIDTAAIRAEHTRGEVVIGEGYCRRDKLPWPCDAIRLADALDRQREETARLREQNLATDHDAFAALEAETARLRVERDEALEAYRGQALLARFDAEKIEQQRDDTLDEARADINEWKTWEAKARGRAEKAERDLAEIRALCFNPPRTGSRIDTVRQIRAILDREDPDPETP